MSRTTDSPEEASTDAEGEQSRAYDEAAKRRQQAEERAIKAAAWRRFGPKQHSGEPQA